MARFPHRRVMVLFACLVACESAPVTETLAPAPTEATSSDETGAPPVPSMTSRPKPPIVPWHDAESAACRFAVKLPQPPQPQPPQPNLLDQVAVDNGLEQYAMLASCGDVKSVRSEQDFLDVTSDVIAKHLKAKVLSKVPLESEGRLGVQLDMHIAAANRPAGILWSGDMVYRLRLFVAGTRQYQLHFLHAAGTDRTELGRRFFESFRFLKGAPGALPPLTWTTHRLGGVSVEAPGKLGSIKSKVSGYVEGGLFEADKRGIGLGLSIWKHPPGPKDKMLRTHFLLRNASEDVEVLEEKKTTVSGAPALDVIFYSNTPLPPHLIPDDPLVHKQVKRLIATRRMKTHVRLVVHGNRIVQLLGFEHGAADLVKIQRFMSSLKL